MINIYQTFIVKINAEGLLIETSPKNTSGVYNSEEIY